MSDSTPNAPDNDDLPDVQLSRKRVSTLEPCPKLDPSGRCTYLNIDAPVVPGKGGPACGRQAPFWSGKAPTCDVPKLLQLSYKSEHYRNEKVREAAIIVLNVVAEDDRCPYMKQTETGPLCKNLSVPCVKPQGHYSCKVYNVLSNMKGMVRGGQAFAAVQQAYDAEVSEIEGTQVKRVDPQSFTVASQEVKGQI